MLRDDIPLLVEQRPNVKKEKRESNLTFWSFKFQIQSRSATDPNVKKKLRALPLNLPTYKLAFFTAEKYD